MINIEKEREFFQYDEKEFVISTFESNKLIVDA
jgi:hypothetical protein